MNTAEQEVLCPSSPIGAPLPSRAKVVFYDGEAHQVRRSARQLFGRALEDWEYAGLAGAPDDALVEIGMLQGGIYLELCQPVSSDYRGSHLVHRLSLGVVLLNEGFHIQRRCLQQKGLGLHVVHRQLHAAKTLGVLRTMALAGRGQRENGYYTWPRYGFDGPLPVEVRRRLPKDLERNRTVLDLIECEPGRLWWKQHGVPLHVSFDLADGSRSWAVFRQYLEQVRQRGGISA